MKIWGSVKNVKIIGVFYLSGTFKKRKGNLGQECVKRGLLFFHGKTGKIASDFPMKNDSFPVLALLFHLSLPKIWHSHLHKIYIFRLSNNWPIR